MMSSISYFIDALEIIKSDRDLKKLDEYQRYNLAIESMKSEMLAYSSEKNKQQLSDLVHVLNDTDDHPFARALESIAESIEGVIPGILDVRLDTEIPINLINDVPASISIDESLYGKEVSGDAYERNSRGVMEMACVAIGTLMGTKDGFVVVYDTYDQKIRLCDLKSIKFTTDGDADVSTS